MTKYEAGSAVGWVALIVVCALFVGSSTSLTATHNKTRGIPPNICSLIATKYPDWRLLKVSDLFDADQKLWKEARGEACPGFTEGMFKSTSKKSYFCLVVPKAQPAKSNSFVVKLLFVEANERGGVVASEIQSDGPIPNSPVIWRMPPGELEDIESGKKVKSQHDFLILEYMESSSQAFYWDGVQFVSIAYTT